MRRRDKEKLKIMPFTQFWNGSTTLSNPDFLLITVGLFVFGLALGIVLGEARGKSQ